MWPLNSFFSPKTVVPSVSDDVANTIKQFKTQLSVLQTMDKHIIVVTVLASASYLVDYSLCLAVCSSFLTTAIMRRIHFYPNYREVLDKLIDLSQRVNEQEKQDILRVLQPFLAASNSTDSWLLRLYGETSIANPLRALLPTPVWLGIDAAVDWAFPVIP